MAKSINLSKNLYSRIDTALIERLKVLADKENKVKEYKRRLRIKGKIIGKGATKKGNATLTIKKDGDSYKFTILKSHKDRYALAGKIKVGKSVSIEGIPKFRMIICTRLKLIEKGIDKNKQMKINAFGYHDETRR